MRQINVFLAGRLAVITRLLAEVTAKGASVVNEPHVVPGMTLSKARQNQRQTRMPYLSIFGMR